MEVAKIVTELWKLNYGSLHSASSNDTICPTAQLLKLGNGQEREYCSTQTIGFIWSSSIFPCIICIECVISWGLSTRIHPCNHHHNRDTELPHCTGQIPWYRPSSFTAFPLSEPLAATAGSRSLSFYFENVKWNLTVCNPLTLFLSTNIVPPPSSSLSCHSIHRSFFLFYLIEGLALVYWLTCLKSIWVVSSLGNYNECC